MPLSQRVSGSHERKSSADTTGKKSSALETEEELRDALQHANTEWNKANEARDKFHALYEQANKKLSESNKAKDDLKCELQAVKEHNAALKQELQRFKDALSAMKYDNINMSQNNEELNARYESLLLRYSTTQQPSPTNPLVGPLPERPKHSRSSTKDKHRDRDERGRTKDKEREKEKQREHKAEKERLSLRFEGKRPPPANRRDSFIEGWGPGGRSGSVNPSSRAYTNVATGRMQAPALTPSHQPAYSSVPRISNTLSPGLYGNTTLAFDDDDDDEGEFEDGNYHAHPLTR